MGWWVGWLAPKIFRPLHMNDGASSKIDDFLTEDGGLGWWWVAYRILVSAPVPFWVYWCFN